MPFTKTPTEYIVLAIGANFPIPTDDFGVEYLVTGTINLGAVNNDFTYSGALSDGLTYVYKYQAVVTYTGAGSITFHGTALSATQALKNQIIIATYNAVTLTWNVDIIPDLAQNNAIAITKLSDLARGFVIIGNSTGVPVAVDAKTAAYLLAGDGTDCLSMQVDSATGDISASVAGGKLVFAIGNLKVLTAMINDLAVTGGKIAAGAVDITKLSSTLQTFLGAQGWLTFDVTVPTASVLTGNGTPYDLVAAPGAGLVIDPISVTEEVVNAGVVTAYATNTTSQIIHDTATLAIFENPAVLLRTIKGVTKSQPVVLSAATLAATQYVANKKLQWKVKNGNPITGDSDIRVQGYYKIIAATV